MPYLAIKFTGVQCSYLTASAGFDLKTINEICRWFLWSGSDISSKEMLVENLPGFISGVE